MTTLEDVGVEDNVLIEVRRWIPDAHGEGHYGAPEAQTVHNLLTTAGRNFYHNQILGTSLGANGANYIALTTDGAAANAADTTLASEIALNGLQRAQGTVTHTPGATTTTVVKQFTAGAGFTNVQKSGLFTAAADGTMCHEALFSAVTLATLDQITVTWTITLS